MNDQPALPPTLVPQGRSIASLPGPTGMPLVGNALQFKSHNMHLQFEAWARQFGPFYQLRLGSRRIMVVGKRIAPPDF